MSSGKMGKTGVPEGESLGGGEVGGGPERGGSGLRNNIHENQMTSKPQPRVPSAECNWIEPSRKMKNSTIIAGTWSEIDMELKAR
jgi:hypothetical protein